MDREELKKYIESNYNAAAEFPWVKYPEYMVLRHAGNKKWFAIIMTLPKEKLGLRSNGLLEVVNVKCDPAMTGSLRMEQGFFPAYHMNKENWITIALDHSVDDEKIRLLLDMSYDLTAPKPKKHSTQTAEQGEKRI